uniref:Ice-binding protein n=1 Tax=Flammulina populicola TaxID=72155 RepID=IBP_FLAPO|nr:RecName: Full=Ice-binding protein; AltName: Full=Antifreeze protein; Short=AFP; Flags: Precursor [Flammulina populicola]ACL27144.1 ice-binding protein [Flammulina populicola]
MTFSILSIFVFGLISSSVALGPAPVLLGKAENFAILSETGVSNVPDSSVNCDIGVSPIGASGVTGFSLTGDSGGSFSTSKQVTGRVYASTYGDPTPASLTTAVFDMENAYKDAQERIDPDFTNLHTGALGGAILVPGLYKFTTGVSITADLVLTGGPTDTYIFQIAGTLSLAAGVKINLVGGLLPANVVWAVADSVTVAATSSFQGILLGKTQVVVNTNASVEGRILAQTAVVLQKATVIVPGVCGA